MTFTADKIRNILLAGHGGSGKTALAEAMLFKSGATERMGSTNEGSTVSDFDPEEIRRKISINTSLATTVWQDTRINIIDAPGQFDFIGGMYEGMPRHHQGVQSRRRSEQGKNARRNLHGSRELRFL